MTDQEPGRFVPPYISTPGADGGFPPVADPLAGVFAAPPASDFGGAAKSTDEEVDEAIKEVLDLIEHGSPTGGEQAAQAADPKSAWAGSEAASGPEPKPEGSGFAAPWAFGGPEAEPTGAGSESPAPPPDFQSAVALAVADVYHTAQGDSPLEHEDREEPPHGEQKFDPATAAAVAVAMASVFAELGNTRFSTGQPQSAGAQEEARAHPGGAQDPLDMNDIISSIMTEAVKRTPKQEAQPESGHVVEAADYVVVEPTKAETKAPADGGAERGPAPDQPADRRQEAKSQPRRQPEPRQKERGEAKKRPHKRRRKLPKPVVAKGSKVKGMRGRLNVEKNSINMSAKVKTMSSPSRAIPIFLLAMVCIGLFAKFGVVDVLAYQKATLTELGAMQGLLATGREAVRSYPELKEAYDLYGSGWMTEAELAQVDIMDALGLAEEHLLYASWVKEFDLEGNNLTVVFSSVTLQSLAGIIQRMEASPIVGQVTVLDAESVNGFPITTAGGYIPPETSETVLVPEAVLGADSGKNVSATLLIQLQKAQETPEESQEAAPAAEGGDR